MIVGETPRFGRRKPIESKENALKPALADSQNVLQVKGQFPEVVPKTQMTETLKPKLADSSANTQVLSLPQSGNIKNYSVTIARQAVQTKEAEALTEEPKVSRKKQVERITTSILIGYNQLRDLTGLGKAIDAVMFNAFDRLQWLDLQHNYLTGVSEEITLFKNLKTLYLHANYIPSIREFTNIRSLTNLRNLTVHGNPLVRIPNFRLYFIAIFPNLKKLDTVLISKKEKDNARVLFEDFKIKSLPVYAESDCPVPPVLKEINPAKDD